MIGQTVYHAELGACTVLDFDKSGMFYLRNAWGRGGWYFINEFSREMAS